MDVQKRTELNKGIFVLQKWVQRLSVILLEGIILLFVFFVWLRPFRVSGDSMSPELNEGEIILIDRFKKYFSIPERGDLVSFSDENGVFIKRIVGLPGETVEVIGGTVYIDGYPLIETQYANHLTGDAAAVQVPEGSLYLLGDNRSEMYDSRMEEIGCRSLSDIGGVVRFRIFPANQLTVFK